MRLLTWEDLEEGAKYLETENNKIDGESDNIGPERDEKGFLLDM